MKHGRPLDRCPDIRATESRVRQWFRGIGALLVGAVLVSIWGCDRAASVLTSAGVQSASETRLGWFLLVTACAVTMVVTVLVLIPAFRRRTDRERAPAAPGAVMSAVMSIDAAQEASENRWITVFALMVPGVILTAAFLITIVTVNAVGTPGHPYVGSVVVTGHQWWWELAYEDSSGRGFTTANEIHLPVGEPVQFKLQTGDVIHSFWVPQLAGKMDIIPGQNNTTWLEATVPGIYSGPCGEYCGNQHAQMRLTVVAESAEAYHAWLETERSAAPIPTDSAQARGQSTFLSAGCASCHTIRGTAAGGGVGPDLTHIASRRMLAGGALPNTQANLMAWIADAQAIKPGNDMPRMSVAPRDLVALVAYLETLK